MLYAVLRGLVRSGSDNYIYAFGQLFNNGFFRYSISGNSWAAMNEVPQDQAGEATIFLGDTSGAQQFFASGGIGTNLLWRYRVQYTTFNTSGTFTSAGMDLKAKGFTTMTWNADVPAQTGANSLKFQVATSSDGNTYSSFSGPSGTGSYYTSSPADISAVSGARYFKYKAFFATADTAYTPTLNDVTINYSSYNTSGDLTSSVYNTGDATNLVTKLAWSASGVSSTATLKFQIRSAPNNAGAPGTWSGWCGYSDCSGTTYFNTADNNVTLSGAHPLRSNSDDQWFQYKIFLGSDGVTTATVNSVTITYVVNAPPNFDANYPTAAAGGVSASQDITPASPTFGKVLINYSIRDTDTSTGSANPGFITPSFEYNIGGGWVSIGSGNLGAGDTSNKAVDGSNYTTYTATWNAPAQIPTNYLTTARVRVTANDNEGANNTVQAISATFTLDTKVPVISAFTIDASTSKLVITSTDDTNLEYLVSNNADFTADGLNGTSGSYQSAGANSIDLNPSWTLPTMTYPTVYLKIRDAAGNISTATAVAPSTPTNMDIKDISNPDADSFKEFISWSPFVPTTGSAFSKYEVYRSTDGSSFSLLGNVIDVNTNYYADFDLTEDQTYYYKVRVVDTTGDKSNYSSVVNDAANGQGGTDTTSPSITNVTVTDTQATSATITWTTDELADSRIDYSIDPSTVFGSGQTNASFLLSHSLTLTGLTPNTPYLFRVKGSDALGNTGTNDNSGDGFSFSTSAGPIISNVTQSSVNVHTATVAWDTNVDSDSFVTFSENPDLSASTKVGSATLVGGSAPFQHRVDLTNLTPGTPYYYFVESKDVDDNNSRDDNGGNYYTFNTTTDNVDPIISDISTPVIAPTAAVVVWQTDELATSQMDWGTTSGDLGTTTPIPMDSTLTIFHVISLTGLVEDTDYFYKVRSQDGAGNETESDEGTFKTGKTTIIQQITVSGGGGGGGQTIVVDKTPPKITDVKIDKVTPFSATITFTTDEKSIGLVQYSEDESAFSQGVGSTEFQTTHSVVLSGLKLATPYFIQVSATDQAGNASTSDVQDFTTQYFSESGISVDNAEAYQSQVDDAIASILPSLVPPFIQQPTVTNITDSGATISWKTNIKSFGVVSYAPENSYDAGRDNPYDGQVSNVNDKITEHTVTLTNLNSNTVYHYAVQAFTLPQVTGTSRDLTFTTKALSVQAQVSNVTNSSFEVNWRTTDPTTSVVEYRNTKTNEVKQTTNLDQTTTHHLTAQNLIPGTTYEVNVFGTNAKGNKVQTANALLVKTSVDVVGPVITSLKIDTALIPGSSDKTQTIISWKTDEPSTSTIGYEEGSSGDATKPLANKVEIANSFVQDHAVVLSTLKPGGLYRIQVSSTDSAGNKTQFPIRTIVVARQSQSILDVIFKNFEDTFSFLKK
jgi:hypothetical protein